jgi:hypothetical protein
MSLAQRIVGTSIVWPWRLASAVMARQADGGRLYALLREAGFAEPPTMALIIRREREGGQAEPKRRQRDPG